MLEAYLEIMQYKLNIDRFNLDGTRSLVKKIGVKCRLTIQKRSTDFQYLIMIEGNDIPITNGGIINGNRNNLYQIVL